MEPSTASHDAAFVADLEQSLRAYRQPSPWERRLLGLADTQEKMQILHLASQGGALSLMLAARGHLVRGRDSDAEKVSVAQAAAEAAGLSDLASFRRAAIHDLSDLDSVFDLVLTDRGLLHADLETMLRHSRRILAARGRLVLALHGPGGFLEAAGAAIEAGETSRAVDRLQALLRAWLYDVGLCGEKPAYRLIRPAAARRVFESYGFESSATELHSYLGIPSTVLVEASRTDPGDGRQPEDTGPPTPGALADLVDCGAPLRALDWLASAQLRMGHEERAAIRVSALVKAGRLNELPEDLPDAADLSTCAGVPLPALIAYARGDYARAADLAAARAESSPATALLGAAAMLSAHEVDNGLTHIEASVKQFRDDFRLWGVYLLALMLDGQRDAAKREWSALVEVQAKSEGIGPSTSATPRGRQPNRIELPNGRPDDSRSDERSEVRLRRFPFPYRAMLAISNDIDMSTARRFREVHRFLNTTEMTPMGSGVGLDVADSMWFYHPHGPTVDERSPLSYFRGYDWTESTPFADELLHYVKAGWIDSLHAYGNFSAPLSESQRFTRRHAEQALSILNRHDLSLKVWINHGTEHNIQNVGPNPTMQGDVPSSPAYHWDLTSSAGMEFVWTGSDIFSFSHANTVSEISMDDGTQSLRFARFYAAQYDDAIADGVSRGVVTEARLVGMPYIVLWHPRNFHAQLSDRRLSGLVQSGQFAIVAQHFGQSSPLLGFGTRTLEALRRLADYHDRGDILVARTVRLLEFNRTRDRIRYSAQRVNDRLVIDIEGVADGEGGMLPPEIDRLRGLTWYVPDKTAAEIRIRGKLLDARFLRKNPSDGIAPSVGIAWFDVDHTDYSREFDTPRFQLSASQSRLDLGALQRKAATLLDEQQGEVPESVTQEAYDYALRYSKRHYAAGLAAYAERLRKLGFSGYPAGLDIGAGPGHWSLVFALENGSVEGVDTRREFVHIGNRVANGLGYGDRVHFQVGAAERLPYADHSFPVAWTHSVFHFVVEIEAALAETARVLTPRGLFYCGYSTFGYRVLAVIEQLANGQLEPSRRQIATLVGHQLYQYGLHWNRWSMVRSHDFDQLIAAAAVFGFTFIDEPGVQDGRPWVLGHRATVDFLARRERAPDALRKEMTAAPLDDGLCQRLDQLVAVGCPRTAAMILADRGSDVFENGALRRIYLRALIKSGQVGDGRAEKLEAEVGDPLLRGMLRQQRREDREALSMYEKVEDSCSEKPFLIASVLFALNRDADARSWLDRGLGDAQSEIACRIGWLEYASRRGDLDEMKEAYAAFIKAIASRTGTEAEADQMLTRFS